MRSRHLALKHQHERSNQGGQGSVLSQPMSRGVRRYRAGWRRCGQASGKLRARIVNLTRIGGDNFEPAQDRVAAISRRAGRQRSSFSMATTRRRAFDKQRSGQAARAGADFDDGRSFERSCGAGDAAGQIEIEQEVLAEALFGCKAGRADDIAKRRQSVRRAQGAPRRCAAWRRRGEAPRSGCAGSPCRCRRAQRRCRGPARCARREARA